MKMLSGWIKAGMTALTLVAVGCASDTSKQVGVGGATQFTDLIEVSGDLNGTVGAQYGGSSNGVTFRMKGAPTGTPFFWTVVGDPPPGVEKYPLGDTIPSTIQSPTFSLKGTPTACGQYPMTFTVHTYPGHQTVVAAIPLTVTVGGGCLAPQITTASIDLIRDASTSRQLGLTGGTPPYTWSVTGLNAVPGMAFDPATGTLSGTPTQTVTTILSVQVTDNLGRSDSQPVSVTVRQYLLEDFTGTWSGLLTQGYFQKSDGSYVDVSGQRLSLLLSNPTTVIDPVTSLPYLTNPITQGTLGNIVLSPVPTGMSLQPSAAGYRGLFNGLIPDLKWHFTCDPDPNAADTLICVGHHFGGAAYDAQVILTRVSVAQQDSTPPTVSLSNPENGASSATIFPLTVTFSEPMSSSGTVVMTQGSAAVGPVTFTTLTTAIIPLSSLNSNTTYSLALNPAGQARFMDLAGNPLPTTTITFTTGVLVTAKITVQKAGSGNGSVAVTPSGILCDASQTTCAADLSVGTPLTLIAAASAGSEFIEWSGGACSGSGNCQVTLNADTTVIATFDAIPEYALTVNIPSGGGTISSNPSGLVCASPITCSGQFLRDTVVTLSVEQPEPGYTFTGWSGAGCSGIGTCAVTMNNAKTVTANFTLQSYALSVTKNGSGTGTVASNPAGISCGATCSMTVDYGSIVTLTATPSADSDFSGWSGGGCSGNGDCAVTVESVTNVTATFTLKSYALTVTKTGNGTVTSNPSGISCGASCSASFTHGATVTLTATAGDANSILSSWGGACAGIGTGTGTSTGTCTVTMDAAKAVTVTFALKSYTLTVGKVGNGTVSSDLAGISCGSTCSASYTFGSNVTMTAVPASGYTFSGWSGDCTGASCTLLMNAVKSVTATFTAIPTYTVTVTPAGSGAGTVTSSPSGITCGATCSAGFSSGTSVTLTASSTAGSVFTGWSGAGCSGTGACTVTVSADTTVTATFDPQPTFQLAVTIGGTGSGSVVSNPSGINCPATCSANFAQNASVILTVTASTGSTFAGWSGACTGNGSCVVTMDQARSVTATFTLQSYTLTVTTSGSATGTVTSVPSGISCGVTCSSNYTYNTSVALAAQPATGYVFSGWGGACAGTGSCSVAMTGAKTVTATFTAQTYSVTVGTTGLGSGVVTSSPAGISCPTTCTLNFVQDSTVTLTATPSTGSSFGGWTGDCAGTDVCTLTMNGSKSATATFTADGFTLSVTRSGDGTGTVTSTPAGISCGTTCAAVFANNTQVTLTATPDAGSVFSGWSGAGCSGTGSCIVTMLDNQPVIATFTAQSGVIAYGQSFTYRMRQQTTPAYKVYHAIKLTGYSPNPGSLTVRITRFPAHQDPNFNMNMVTGGTYQFVDPITGALTQAVATESATVNRTVGDPNYGVITGAPYIVWTPTICHDYFAQDSIEFVVIDSLGNVSPPATIYMNTPLNVMCVHAF